MSDKKKLLLEELLQELTVPGGQFHQTDHNPSGTSQMPKKVSLVDLIDLID